MVLFQEHEIEEFTNLDKYPIDERGLVHVVLFAGQGSHDIGMLEQHLTSSIPKVIDLVYFAKRMCPRIIDLTINGPKDELDKCENAQVAVFVDNVCSWYQYERKYRGARNGYFPKLRATAGFSLGEYASLVIAGHLSPEEGLRLVIKRGLSMKYACEVNPGAMANVQGLEEQELDQIAARSSCYTANHIFQGAYVVAGTKQNIDVFTKEIGSLTESTDKSRKIKSKLLEGVTGPFHSPLMHPAIPSFKKALSDTSFSVHSEYAPGKRLWPVCYSNVTSRPHPRETGSIRDLLSRHLLEKVEWERSICNIIEDLDPCGDSGIQFVCAGGGNTQQIILTKISPLHGKQSVCIDGH